MTKYIFVPKGTTFFNMPPPRIQGVAAKNNNKNTPNCEANEICNFCINSIKIPIVVRIFANTIYLCVRADRARGRGMPDNMEVRQYRLTEYPIPVHSTHCSHDKGHLYASFGARFPGQCHKRLPLWSGCRVELEGGWVKKGSGWQPQSFQYGANSICICLSHPSPINRPAPPSHCLCLWLCFGPDLQVAP